MYWAANRAASGHGAREQIVQSITVSQGRIALVLGRSVSVSRRAGGPLACRRIYTDGDRRADEGDGDQRVVAGALFFSSGPVLRSSAA